MTTLVLTAHGSRDPRSADNARAVADQIRLARPELAVRVAFCELNTPRLPDVLTPDAVVTPFLLADAYHAKVDIPNQIASRGLCVPQAEVLGEDDRLVAVLRERLDELSVSSDDPRLGVVVVAIGSTDAEANARTARVAGKLCVGTRWAGATTAFATGGGVSPAEAVSQLRRRGARRVAIAPWFLAHGLFTDRVANYAAAEDVLMAEPLGAHSGVVETVLARYDAALVNLAAA